MNFICDVYMFDIFVTARVSTCIECATNDRKKYIKKRYTGCPPRNVYGILKIVRDGIRRAFDTKTIG